MNNADDLIKQRFRARKRSHQISQRIRELVATRDALDLELKTNQQTLSLYEFLDLRKQADWCHEEVKKLLIELHEAKEATKKVDEEFSKLICTPQSERGKKDGHN